MKKVLILFLIVFVTTFVFTRYSENTGISIAASNQIGLQIFHESDLAPFNGSDNYSPIYIGLNGYVYDVSAGREFYKSDGPYHYLAGKDSSSELNIVGGGIIKNKYPIIGRLIK